MTTDSTEALFVHIRWAIRRDMEEICEIERACFFYPWTEEDFIRRLRQTNCIGMVAEHGERVVGFMVYELHKTRFHLLNLAVAPECQRRGVGRQIVEKLKGKLSSQRRTRMTLEIADRNLDGQLFFREMGFFATTILRGFYGEAGEDAYFMQYRHPGEFVVDTSPNNRIGGKLR